MKTNTMRRLAVALTAAALLAGCGGADAGTDDAATTDTGRLADGATATDPNSIPGQAESDPGASQGIAEGEPNPSAPGGAPQAEEPREDCSAGDLMVAAVQPEGVSEAAAATWNALREAAMACDYAGLADLASDDGFTSSYGAGTDAAAFWAEAEAAGDDPMAKLVQLSGLPSAVDAQGNTVWPAAHVRPEDDDAWRELDGIYTSDTLDEWREAGSGYLGYRLAITPEGEWIYFVAGD